MESHIHPSRSLITANPQKQEVNKKSLEIDFAVLSKRQSSTSTPFLRRSLPSSTECFTPAIAESSMEDSAFDISVHKDLDLQSLESDESLGYISTQKPRLPRLRLSLDGLMTKRSLFQGEIIQNCPHKNCVTDAKPLAMSFAAVSDQFLSISSTTNNVFPCLHCSREKSNSDSQLSSPKPSATKFSAVHTHRYTCCQVSRRSVESLQTTQEEVQNACSSSSMLFGYSMEHTSQDTGYDSQFSQQTSVVSMPVDGDCVNFLPLCTSKEASVEVSLKPAVNLTHHSTSTHSKFSLQSDCLLPDGLKESLESFPVDVRPKTSPRRSLDSLTTHLSKHHDADSILPGKITPITDFTYMGTESTLLLKTQIEFPMHSPATSTNSDMQNVASAKWTNGLKTELFSSDSSSSDLTPTGISALLEKFIPLERDRLIGPMMGRSHVDMIYHMHIRNISQSIKQILGYLSDKDLCSMCKVSLMWKEAVISDNDASSRLIQRRQRRNIPLFEKENSGKKSLRSLRSMTSSQGPLAEVQTTGTPSSILSAGVASEVKSAVELSHKYWKEAQQLKNEETLRKCPQCTSPAKTELCQDRARCTKSDCAFDFCIRCRTPFHGSRDCGIMTTPKKQRPELKVGSKKNKKNLRRL